MTESGRNVLFVVMDTVRKDHLTPYGYDRPTTPGLEAFAEEATVFEQCVAPAPWTLPVHASLFTGLYPSQHDASQENPYLDGATTLAETLSREGYDTACYSSNAWITPYTHLTDGFDDQDNFFEVMPGEFLSGPLAKAWQTLNDNEKLRAIADKLVSLGNTAHEFLAGAEGADSKTPAVVDCTQEFVSNSRSADGWFAFINLMDAHLPSPAASLSSTNDFVRSMTAGVFESAPSPEARYSWATLPSETSLSATVRRASLSFIAFQAFASGPDRRSPGITSKKLSWSSNPSVRWVYGVIHAFEE